MKKMGQINNKGLTLVEVLITSAILLMVLTITGEAVSRGRDFWILSAMRINLNNEAQVAIDNMVSELRNTTRGASTSPPNVSIDVSQEIMDFYLPTDLDSNGYIVDSNGDTEWNTTTAVQYQFDSNTNQLYRIEGTETRILANHVFSLVFDDTTTDTSLMNDEIRITLTLQDTGRNQRTVNVTRTSIVGLRN